MELNKENEEKMDKIIEELNKKFGSKSLRNLVDFMVEMMILSGDKSALIMKKCQEIIRLIQKIENEFIQNKHKEMQEDVIIFLDDLKNKIDIYYNNL